MTASPPQSQPRRSRPSRGGVVLFLLVLAGAGAVVVFLSRGRGTAAAGSHGHTATAAAAGDSLREVRLAPADARRIGVTFAEVTRTPFGRPVRAVAEVTNDETRLTTVTLKVDGWVERLYVNFTGQAVRRGEPLLRSLLADAGDGAGGAAARAAAGGDVAAAAPRTRSVAPRSSSSRRGAGCAYWDIPPDGDRRGRADRRRCAAR